MNIVECTAGGEREDIVNNSRYLIALLSSVCHCSPWRCHDSPYLVLKLQTSIHEVVYLKEIIH